MAVNTLRHLHGTKAARVAGIALWYGDWRLRLAAVWLWIRLPPLPLRPAILLSSISSEDGTSLAVEWLLDRKGWARLSRLALAAISLFAWLALTFSYGRHAWGPAPWLDEATWAGLAIVYAAVPRWVSEGENIFRLPPRDWATVLSLVGMKVAAIATVALVIWSALELFVSRGVTTTAALTWAVASSSTAAGYMTARAFVRVARVPDAWSERLHWPARAGLVVAVGVWALERGGIVDGVASTAVRIAVGIMACVAAAWLMRRSKAIGVVFLAASMAALMAAWLDTFWRSLLLAAGMAIVTVWGELRPVFAMTDAEAEQS